MKQKRASEKVMSFREAIKGVLNTPYLTHKQIDELRKKEKLKKMKT